MLQRSKGTAGCCFRSGNTNAEICHVPVVLSPYLSLSCTFSVALSAFAGRQDVQQQQQRRQITTTKCIVCKHVTSNNNNNSVQQTTATTTRSCIVCWLILRSVNDAEISTLFFAIFPTLFSLSTLFLCLLLPFLPLLLPNFFLSSILILFYLPFLFAPQKITAVE